MPRKRKNVEKVRQNGSFNPLRFRDCQSRIFYCLNAFLPEPRTTEVPPFIQTKN